MFPNWAKNILFLLVYMISGLVLVIIIEGLVSGSDLLPLNDVIERVITQMRTPLLTSFLVIITKLSDPFILSCVAVFLSALLIMRGHSYDAALFLAAMVLAVISLTILKNIFQITRPASDIYAPGGPWSFPSGHATVAAAFFFLLAHTFFGRMKTVGRKTALIIGSIIAAGLVCFSRLYLGAHWTLDILAGVALGLLIVSFTVLIFNIFIPDKRSLRKLINF